MLSYSFMQSFINHLIFLLGTVIITVFSAHSYAQQISNRVVGSGGSSGQQVDIIFSSTLGEALVSTKTINDTYLGQGFQASHLSELTTSISTENEVLNLKVYPNPFSDELYLSGDFLPERLEIINMQGQVVSILNRPGDRITEWAQLPDGLYVLQGSYNGIQFNIGKIIKINP